MLSHPCPGETPCVCVCLCVYVCVCVCVCVRAGDCEGQVLTVPAAAAAHGLGQLEQLPGAAA